METLIEIPRKEGERDSESRGEVQAGVGTRAVGIGIL